MIERVCGSVFACACFTCNMWFLTLGRVAVCMRACVNALMHK